MNNELLKVPKSLKEVTLWVHPEGRVIGSIFLRNHSVSHAGKELPLEVFNRPEPFIVFKKNQPDELRFYNRKSIIRVEYSGKDAQVTRAIRPLTCQFQLMDGSFINGTIEEPLHPYKARLLDYLNKPEDMFIKLHINNDTILVNKSYIIHVQVNTFDETQL